MAVGIYFFNFLKGGPFHEMPDLLQADRMRRRFHRPAIYLTVLLTFMRDRARCSPDRSESHPTLMFPAQIRHKITRFQTKFLCFEHPAEAPLGEESMLASISSRETHPNQERTIKFREEQLMNSPRIASVIASAFLTACLGCHPPPQPKPSPTPTPKSATLPQLLSPIELQTTEAYPRGALPSRKTLFVA